MHTLFWCTSVVLGRSCNSGVRVQSGRIGADEAIDDTEGKGEEELEERLNENEAKTRAILLEMVSSRHQVAL